MSTRCIIRIKQKLGNKNCKINLYHHYDGYPSGVGYHLIRTFYNKEQNCFNFCDINNVVNTLVKCINDKGYELTAYNHVDIEYLYTIDIDKNIIKCQYVNNWDSKMQIIKNINLLKEYLEDDNNQ